MGFIQIGKGYKIPKGNKFIFCWNLKT